VSANDEIERAFALSNAAVAHNHYAKPKDVEEDAVHETAHRQSVVEKRGQLGDGERCRHGGAQHGHVPSMRRVQQVRRGCSGRGN